jgi:glutathione synthase/RimK-type ligase-like ATP-grasp enzyme
MKDLTHVGAVELVSLPEARLRDVPAKIDTGADSSALWATDIFEDNDELSFTLFAKDSAYYSGRKLTAKHYKVVSIKNSFGEREVRYKVPLKVVIAGRTIQATFTLADRSRNKYPILIGRRTLHGKFLVDVRHKPLSGKPEVLMLSTKRSKVTSNFVKGLESRNKQLRITFACYDGLRFLTGGDGNRIELADSGKDIADFDLIYFKTRGGAADRAAACARYAEARGVPFIDRSAKYYPDESKLHDYFVLTDQKIRVPQSVLLTSSEQAASYDYLADKLDVPFILKDVHGSKGEHNFLIKDRASFAAARKTAASNQVLLIAQRFIPNDGDYRVLVFGSRVALIMHRARTSDKTHLNNTSRGASARLVGQNEMPPGVLSTCERAAQLTNRQIAGVDIVQDKSSGVWYVLEVNIGPQLASGAFKEEKQAALAAYLKRRLS